MAVDTVPAKLLDPTVVVTGTAPTLTGTNFTGIPPAGVTGTAAITTGVAGARVRHSALTGAEEADV